MIGSITPYAGSVIPEGYLVCNGDAVSRETYADLFDVIGTAYGAGDGSTTFNLPNMGGRAVLCNSSSHSIGSLGGEETHLLLDTELPAHSHVVPTHGHGNNIAATMPELTHTITQAKFTYAYPSSNQQGSALETTMYISTASASMSRSTNLAVADHAATDCTMSGGVLDCLAFDTEEEGEGGVHNNMMPYLALVYIIQTIPDTPPAPRMLIYNGCMPVTPGGYYLVGTKR